MMIELSAFPVCFKLLYVTLHYHWWVVFPFCCLWFVICIIGFLFLCLNSTHYMRFTGKKSVHHIFSNFHTNLLGHNYITYHMSYKLNIIFMLFTICVKSSDYKYNETHNTVFNFPFRLKYSSLIYVTCTFLFIATVWAAELCASEAKIQIRKKLKSK